MAFLTDRILAPGVTTNDLIHIVITGDTSQNPAGSSYKATMGQVLDLINPTTITGGTYDSVTGTITFYDDNGGSFNVTGLVTGYTNTAVTAFTYNNSNTFTVIENDGSSHSATIDVVTGMTFNGFLKTSGSTTSGLYSFAFGNNLTSSGDYSFSQGLQTSATTNYTHAQGRLTIASGTYSHSEGRSTESSGSYSHAEGVNSISSGISSHAEGDGTISSGDASHSEGQDTIASGLASHAEGRETLSAEYGTHSEGYQTSAITQYSHSEGLQTITYGDSSHAEGYGTITNGKYQHVQGQFNSTASTQSAFIIGNGSSNSNRSNLVLAAGNTFNIYGNLTITGTTSSGVISATTYQNLPTDIRVTGGTYSSGTAIFTNNTGGTFSVSGFSTPFTGNTSATCITDIYVTNVNSCSPLHIQPTNLGNVFISEKGGSVGIGTTTIDGTAPEVLVVSGFSSNSYNIIVGKTNINNYAQLNIINKGTGTTSSADVVATNNTGTETTNYIDMGINGSNYGGAFIGVANDAYLYSTGRELYIGNATTGSTSNIKFFAGDAATNVDLIISGSTGFVGIGTTTPTTRLDVNGKTRTTTFQATFGAGNNYVLLSDASGNATWSPQSSITGNTDTFVTGFTYNNANTISLTQNNGQNGKSVTINTLTGLTINGNLSVTGTTSTGTISATTYQNLPSLSNLYLPLSGGTVFGNTVFTSGLTGNTLSVTGLTQTKGITSTGGIIFPQVTINSTYSATTNDFMIDVTGGTFTVYLPSAVGIQGRLLNIKNNGGGAITVLPVSGQNIDDKPFVILGETNVIQLASNGTNWVAVSYNISTVNSSTGVFSYTGATRTSSNTFYVSPVKGWIVDDTTNPLSPQLYYASYTGGSHTAIYVSSATETWFFLTSASTITQLNIPPTEQERRKNIFLGKLGHANKSSIVNVFNAPDFVLSPLAQLRDMFAPIAFINGGVLPSPNGANLTFNTSSGYLYGLGINFTSDILNPNALYVSGSSPTTFQYRTQTGGTASNTTTIDPLNYDVGGTITPITGTKATNQRIFLLANGTLRVQYGQTDYNTLSAAIAGIQTETFVTFSNFATNGILIGILSVLSTATALNDPTKAQFFFVSKFGETVGAAGGTSTTTLQQAYNNSVTPEITINSTLDGLSIKNGTGNADNVSNLLEGLNSSGTTTSIIRADGAISGTTLYGRTIDVSGTTGYNQLIARNTYTPSGTTDTNGVVGDISWDTSYLYVKTSAGWKRSGLATW